MPTKHSGFCGIFNICGTSAVSDVSSSCWVFSLSSDLEYPHRPNLLIPLRNNSIWPAGWSWTPVTQQVDEASAPCRHWLSPTIISIIKSNQPSCVLSLFPSQLFFTGLHVQIWCWNKIQQTLKKYHRKRSMAACCHKAHWHLFSLDWSKVRSPLSLPPHQSRSPSAHTHTYPSSLHTTLKLLI